MQKVIGQPVVIGVTESALDRRERILAEKAKRDAEKDQEQRELGAWKYWVNQYENIVI